MSQRVWSNCIWPRTCLKSPTHAPKLRDHAPPNPPAGRLTRKGAGLLAGTVSEERELMCADLQEVLRGGTPRPYGAPCRAALAGGSGGGGSSSGSSGYECLAPAPLYEKLLKLRKPLG